MTFAPDSRGVVERLDVTRTGTVGAAGYAAGTYALTDRKPRVIFFYCNQQVSHGAADAICHCIRMRRMAFSDPRTGAVAGNFEWLELDIDDPASAPWMELYRIRSSPALVFCDPLGNEIRVEHGLLACGRLLEVLEDAQRKSAQRVRVHEGRLERLSASLRTAWEALGAGKLGDAVHGFRNVQTQADDERYRCISEEAARGLEEVSGMARDRLHVILATPGDDRDERLIALRNDTVGLEEVHEEIRKALEGGEEGGTPDR